VITIKDKGTDEIVYQVQQVDGKFEPWLPDRGTVKSGMYAFDVSYDSGNGTMTLDPTGIHGTVKVRETGHEHAWFYVTKGDPSEDRSEIKAEWHFDEASGTTVNDSSGNGFNVSSYNTTIVDGVEGKAHSFNGTNSYINQYVFTKIVLLLRIP